MEVKHSGIKGQKKGVRRYQYANKSYTPAGNARYRPKSGKSDGGGGTVVAATALGGGALAAAYIHSGILGGATVSGTSSAALTAAIAAGKAAVAAVPSGVWALSIPMAIIAAPIIMEDAAKYTRKAIEKLEDQWWW